MITKIKEEIIIEKEYFYDSKKNQIHINKCCGILMELTRINRLEQELKTKLN